MILNPLTSNDKPKFIPERLNNKVAAEGSIMARRVPNSRRLSRITIEKNLEPDLSIGLEEERYGGFLSPSWATRNSFRSNSIPNGSLEGISTIKSDLKNVRRGSLLWPKAAEIEAGTQNFPFTDEYKTVKRNTVPPLEQFSNNEGEFRAVEKAKKNKQYTFRRMTSSVKSPSVPSILEEGGTDGEQSLVKSVSTMSVAQKSKADLWSVFRSHVSTAKAKEAFETSKIYVNQKPHRVLRKIGMGLYSEVFEVVDEHSHLYVLKYVTLPESRIRENLLREVYFLQKLKDNPRVIRLIDYETKTNPDCLLMILEHGECNLDQIVRKLIKKGSFTPAKLRYFWEEMLEVLRAVHETQVVHADIKPSNFVLTDGSLKLIDFGLAVDLNEGKVWTKRNFVAGTRDFLSPETLSCFEIEEGSLKDPLNLQDQQVIVGYKSDIWALGIILYKWMYDGLVPYSELGGGKLSKISALTNTSIPIEFKTLDDPYVMETLKMCLEKDPFHRATLEELLSHRFLHPINSKRRSSFIPLSQSFQGLIK